MCVAVLSLLSSCAADCHALSIITLTDVHDDTSCFMLHASLFLVLLLLHDILSIDCTAACHRRHRPRWAADGPKDFGDVPSGLGACCGERHSQGQESAQGGRGRLWSQTGGAWRALTHDENYSALCSVSSENVEYLRCIRAHRDIET